MKRLGFALFLLLSAVIIACKENRATVEVYFVAPSGKRTDTVRAEVADNESARNYGLMDRHEMGKDKGMLFVFPDSKPRSFWMKNTYLELDMVFIGETRTVVSILRRAVPLTSTPRLSIKPAKYVLEILGGQAEELGIEVGSEAIISKEIVARS